MAEKGGTKILAIVAIIIILISIGFCGCVEDGKDENDKIAVSIRNQTNENKTLDIKIIREQKIVVYNETVNIKPNEFKGLGSIIDGDGIYQIIVNSNNITASNDKIEPSDYCGVVKIWVYDDKILIKPEYK